MALDNDSEDNASENEENPVAEREEEPEKVPESLEEPPVTWKDLVRQMFLLKVNLDFVISYKLVVCSVILKHSMVINVAA